MNGNDCLGKLAREAGHRDAIHVAIISVTAGEPIVGGTKIAVDPDGTAYLWRAGGPDSVGIADPFYGQIEKGQIFYAVLTPNSVTEVRHEWDHPAFPRSEATTPDQKNMEAAAEDPDYFCCGSEAEDFMHSVMDKLRGK